MPRLCSKGKWVTVTLLSHALHASHYGLNSIYGCSDWRLTLDTDRIPRPRRYSKSRAGDGTGWDADLRVKVAKYKEGQWPGWGQTHELMRWKKRTVGPGSLSVRPDKFALVSIQGHTNWLSQRSLRMIKIPIGQKELEELEVTRRIFRRLQVSAFQ